MPVIVNARLTLLATTVALNGCLPEPESSRCGPSRAVVEQVIDGDTVILDTGERVRYLLVDAPENTSQEECYGVLAASYNRALVLGREVRLTYDVTCVDRFGRLLAYVLVDGRSVNEILVEEGYACVLHIPPSGTELAPHYLDLEIRAVDERRGLWAACSSSPC